MSDTPPAPPASKAPAPSDLDAAVAAYFDAKAKAEQADKAKAEKARRKAAQDTYDAVPDAENMNAKRLAVLVEEARAQGAVVPDGDHEPQYLAVCAYVGLASTLNSDSAAALDKLAAKLLTV